MRASMICFLVLLLTATLVSSRPNTSYLTHSFRALSTLSYKRQSSSTPSQCTSTCDPVNNEVNAGCPITACCTQSFETGYYDCLLCVGTALNATDYTQAQADLDELYVSCYDNGYTLQELTLPGQNPSRTLSTSSPAGTSTTTGTSPVSVLSSTSVSKITVLPSSVSSASSGTSTSANGTATSSTSTPTTSSAALGLSAGESGVWALAAVIGLTVL
ncbi:hypothetical protein BDR04DRAFT_1110539 [Suillus decipiens]|nr:hypothetical protein BDR04DRAFT_1110539 [Suillus decipiens]